MPVSSAPTRISTCGRLAASTGATGRFSPVRTEAPRSATAATWAATGCLPARSSGARRPPGSGSLFRVALASFLILARGRHFLDGDAIALPHFLAPAAVGIGHAVALGHALAVANLVAPTLWRLHVLGRGHGREAGRRDNRDGAQH